MAKWLPIMSATNYAFLSNVCYSSAHDDIMRRGLQKPHERRLHESEERMRVRLETLEMVNKAIEDPRKRTTDATIMAVMNLLFSEIMGCNGATMLIHQQGLHNLVQQRGGLDGLGASGQLACTLSM